MLGVLLSSLPMIVCGVLSVLIALSLLERRNQSRFCLLMFMVTATVLYLAHFVYFNRQTYLIPLTDTLYSFCNPAVFPLYYLYIEELTEHRPNRLRQALCMLPSMVCLMAVGGLYLLMDRQETAAFVQHFLYEDEYASFTGVAFWQVVSHFVMRGVFAVQILFVLYGGFRRITAYNALVESNYSNVEGKRIVQCSVHDIEADVFQEEELVSEKSSDSELLERIRRIVDDEKLFLYPNLKVSDLAARLHTNRNYIYHAINIEMGTSFSDYINCLRIDYAAQLLEAQPELSVNDVMTKSGFTSSSAFYRNFKKFKGVTPTKKRVK